jgi:hypothetical protein
MSILIDNSGRQFRISIPATELALETTLTKLADHVFGPLSIFISRKRKLGGKSGIVGIPDGYLFDFADPASPKLFVVEVELRSHDLFKHITEQLVRFAAGFERDQIAVRDFLHKEIQASQSHRARLAEAQKLSAFANVDAMLNKAVFAPFQGLVVIDERSDELDRVLKQFSCTISVLELQTWRTGDGAELHKFETLYDDDEPQPIDVPTPQKTYTNEGRMARRERRARCDTVVVPARKEGFEKTFLGENRWYEIRISPGMRERIRYIAAYQVKPISAVTHLAEVREIRPYGNKGKYELIFKGPAQRISKVTLKNSNNAPFGPVYVRQTDLLKAKYLEDALA